MLIAECAAGAKRANARKARSRNADLVRQGFSLRGVTGRQRVLVDVLIGVWVENSNLEARNPKQIRMRERGE